MVRGRENVRSVCSGNRGDEGQLKYSKLKCGSFTQTLISGVMHVMC